MVVEGSAPVLSRRALNRALLARQLLLARAPMTPLATIAHLVGMQAQAPQAPYVGLWSRLNAFAPESLSSLLTGRDVVRVSAMRGTIHLVTADDCAQLRPLTQPVHERAFQGNWAKYLRSPMGDLVLELDDVAAAARTLLEARPMTFGQLGEVLGQRWPGYDPAALAQVARAKLTLVQPPPRGLWRASGAARHTTAEAWLGRPMASDPSAEAMVRRYLAAFGPASIRDAQSWSGLTRLGAVFARLRPELVMFRDETGRELFDLPEAPRPDPQTPAPVRFLPEYDNVLLSHADRTRIVDDETRATLQTRNAAPLGTVLVDGFARAAWKLSPAALEVRIAGQPLSKRDETAVLAEGRRLLAFASTSPDAPVTLL